ncbi:hypothetical protein C8R47DRAFT_978540 [Mycena vitilis]|nr:hypothetical protein C8R47DRAFT_978540 [Mycena vitilis]
MSSSSYNTNRRRPAATGGPRRRPLARTNSSLLGTIKNIVTAPLAWFAPTEDFEDSPDLKGKRRRHPAPNSSPATDDSEGGPRSKRVRVKSPDNQIQFHPEPQYVSPAYTQPSMGYLDPPVSVFNNNNDLYRSNSVNITAPTLNQYNPSNRSGLSRTMSIDPPHSSFSFPRDTPMNFIPLDRDTSVDTPMESFSFIRKSSSIPRDLSMPLPPTRGSFRMHTSLTPQPAQPREVSEPPPLSSLAQKPMFVRPPPDSHQRLSSQSSTSTLGSLAESQRSTRSPMRQHSSLLFGSGSQSQATEANNARQPPPAERALHELDIYKTPLLPTRSRLRSSPPDTKTAKVVDPSDMFRPRRSSQLLLMRDDRRASASGRKSKAKVNETKPYAGEGGMKKLLARRMKEVEDEEVEDTEVMREKDPAEGFERSEPSQPSRHAPEPSNWQKTVSSQPASSGSSLRVGRTKTSRAHLTRPIKASRKFSAVFEEDIDESMEDGENLERQKEHQALEEAARRLPAFEVPAGFSFAKEPNAKPVEHNPNAKEPPIVALPFSFGKPSVPSEPTVSLSVPKVAPAAIPQPTAFAWSSGPASEAKASLSELNAESSGVTKKTVEPETHSSSPGSVPNFFASSKLLSQAPAVSNLLPPAPPLFGVPSPAPLASPFPDLADTPKPPSSVFPSTPTAAPSFAPTLTPIKDTDNPLWEGEYDKKDKRDSQSSLFNGTGNGQTSSLFGAKIASDGQAPSAKADITPTPSFGGSIFGTNDTTPSIVDVSKPSTTSGFKFGGGGTSTEPSSTEAQLKPAMAFGSTTGTTSAASGPEVPKAPAFPFGQAASNGADAAKSSLFGAPTASPFTASSAVPEAPKPAFGSFAFGEPKESKPSAASPFTFGPTPSTMTPEAGKPAGVSPFSFGSSVTSAAPAASPFSFGSTTNAEPKPVTPGGGSMFTFGTPAVIAPSARPSTPPRNEMQEFTMEESPTRDMQVNTESKPTRPTLGGAGSGFSFNNASSGSLFGQAPAAPAPAPFSFGGSPSSNLFPPAENKPFGGTDFGRPSSASSPFAFGQNNTPNLSIDTPRPSSTGSFSFQSAGPPAGPVSSAGPGFSFGGGNSTNTSLFAPQPTVGSAPNSPSTFNQPFSFGAPAPQQSGSFSFGPSQPVSPAGPASSLPQPTTPGGFGGGGGFGAQPSSPFGAAPQPSGGLFTIGAAPPPAPAGNAPRVLKKLPRRKNN